MKNKMKIVRVGVENGNTEWKKKLDIAQTIFFSMFRLHLFTSKLYFESI